MTRLLFVLLGSLSLGIGNALADVFWRPYLLGLGLGLIFAGVVQYIQDDRNTDRRTIQR